MKRATSNIFNGSIKDGSIGGAPSQSMDFERLLEEFEERAVASPSEAFSFAAGQLFPGCGEAEILANPLIICEKLSFDSLYKLELQIQVQIKR